MTSEFEKEKQTINKVLDKFRDAPGKLGEIVERLEKYPEGEKVLKSLIRQEKEHSDNWHLTFWVSITLLLVKSNNWFYKSQSTQLRPRERQEAINRIFVNSMNILMDVGYLELPINASRYFNQQELFERYQQLFTMFDLPDELTEPGYVNFKEKLKEYVEGFWSDYPKSDVLLPDLLIKLADPELLDKLAAPSIVSKTKSENSPRVFMIRKLAGWFRQFYGKELHNTIANLCVLIFDDTSIDRDTVRSALSGYEVEAETDWFRLNTVAGYKKNEPEGG